MSKKNMVNVLESRYLHEKMENDTVIEIRCCSDCPYVTTYNDNFECWFNPGNTIRLFSPFGGVSRDSFKCPIKHGRIILIDSVDAEKEIELDEFHNDGIVVSVQDIIEADPEFCDDILKSTDGEFLNHDEVFNERTDT